jgi:low affinity Fe/Cu permease
MQQPPINAGPRPGAAVPPGPVPTGGLGPRRSRVIHRVGDAAANAMSGVLAALLGGCWVVVGWLRGFPDWWQIALYSATALTTFVMVFVIQHTQSRQVAALQRKLDELIRSSRQADNALIAVEHAPAEELQQLADASRDRRTEALGG